MNARLRPRKDQRLGWRMRVDTTVVKTDRMAGRPFCDPQGAGSIVIDAPVPHSRRVFTVSAAILIAITVALSVILQVADQCSCRFVQCYSAWISFDEIAHTSYRPGAFSLQASTGTMRLRG
jgi:hypothetical protein